MIGMIVLSMLLAWFGVVALLILASRDAEKVIAEEPARAPGYLRAPLHDEASAVTRPIPR